MQTHSELKCCLRRRLAKPDLTVGSWVQLGQAPIAEIMAAAGYDWIVVDLEHSVISLRQAEEMIRIIRMSGVDPLVRLSHNDPVQIKRVMDAGAEGIIVPMVKTAAEIAAAVERGALPAPRHARRGPGAGAGLRHAFRGIPGLGGERQRRDRADRAHRGRPQSGRHFAHSGRGGLHAWRIISTVEKIPISIIDECYPSEPKVLNKEETKISCLTS